MSVLLLLVKLAGIYFHNVERLKGEHHEEHEAIEHGERKEHGKGEEHIPPLALSFMGILGLIAAYLTGGERNELSLNTPQSKFLLIRRSFRANPDADNLWFALIYEVAARALTRQNKTDFALVGKFFLAEASVQVSVVKHGLKPVWFLFERRQKLQGWLSSRQGLFFLVSGRRLKKWHKR